MNPDFLGMNPEFLERLVEEANRNNDEMSGMTPAEAGAFVSGKIAAAELVIGTWKDLRVQGGVNFSIIKGNPMMLKDYADGLPLDRWSPYHTSPADIACVIPFTDIEQVIATIQSFGEAIN
jgi:hypothetical protein